LTIDASPGSPGLWSEVKHMNDQAKFLSDDRHGRLTPQDLSRSGGKTQLALARLLDDERDDSFEKVLDTGCYHSMR
jgi:hypothetical protein